MYTKAKEAAKYRSTKPTLTDQSQAEDTDLNIIYRKYLATGAAPGAKTPLPPGDYTNAPTDLRGYIELGRSINKLRNQLPKELQNLTLEQIATMNNKQLDEYIRNNKPPEQQHETSPTNIHPTGSTADKTPPQASGRPA